MIRRGTLLLAATMTVLLIWLLVGCAGREGAGGGQKQKAGVGHSSDRADDQTREGPSLGEHCFGEDYLGTTETA